MPGLNQLKKFSEDIREIGDEAKLRAQRGEKVVEIPLPQNISEEDDSDEFIIGLPDSNSDSQNAQDGDVDAILNADSDVDFSALDSILGPQVSADEDALADFENDTIDSPEELGMGGANAAEETPLEDLDLDSLLAPSGDGSDSAGDGLEELGEINLNDDIPASVLDDDGVSQMKVESAPAQKIPSEEAPKPDINEALSGLGDLTDFAATGSFDNADASASDGGLSDLGSFDIDSLIAGDSSDSSDAAEVSEPADLASPADSIENLVPSADAGTLDSLGSVDSLGSDASLDSLDSSLDGLGSFENASFDDSLPSVDAADIPDIPADSNDFDLASFASEIGSGEDLPAEELSAEEIPAEKSLDEAIPEAEPEIPSGEEISDAQEISDDSSSADSADFSDLGDLDSFDMDSSSGSDSLGDLGSFNIDSLIDGNGDSSSADAGAFDSADSSDVPDAGLMDFDSLPSDNSFEAIGEVPDATMEVPDATMEVPSDSSEEATLEAFDTTGMEDVDFGPSKPDSGDEFPSTDEGLSKDDDDDFLLDSSFEIPGFSDTVTADMGKKKSGLDIVDFSKGKEARPKNSLTEEEYVQFKKNLANYPLNLRIALEDFIARDEFTDDAIFEIIEKVLKNTSARQLATQLEKILDISISIPRDFERRSFAEYEAYKQSFQYQLRNRIIPAAIVGVILCFVCFGLFKAGQHFIYKPVMANINYKQGYTLLEANEFPQSEEKFWTAVSYRPVKNWFFKYAMGYREKKQFERAGQMYKNILAYFNHDKIAGLDFAEMELYDRANYERAEEIVRREVLDYHINDADGILLLGDVFLEWAEVDPSKYELAKQQYLDLLQRYGGSPVYLSRMLRYNIRTDKLREVLTYKNMLYFSKQDKQNLKNLGAADWTELSGYLLEKLYGTLSKNDEYLRSSIEDVLAMLNLAIKADPANPVGHYNLARYFIQNGNTEQAKVELERSLDLFDDVLVRTKKNVYREINATRVLGELYAVGREYLKAQTLYTRGINLYNEEHEAADLEGDVNTGKLFADMGDLDYFISGELDDALYNYEKAIEIKNDTPSINYRVGSIYYGKKDYDNALVSFIKVSEKEPRDPNVLLSLGNVLSLRGDNFAAESYYSDLLKELDKTYARQKILLPQSDEDDYTTVDLYLKANNNLGVTLHRLAQQTGNSNMNAEAMVRLSDSIRAYDALTRNQKTMIRMEGSNLAAQNSKYITHPYPEFEPAIYTDIPRLLSGEKGLE